MKKRLIAILLFLLAGNVFGQNRIPQFKEGDGKAHFYKFINGKFIFIKDLPAKKS